MVDLVKQQSYIRASVFRDEIAKFKLEELLKKADESVSLSTTTTTSSGPDDDDNKPDNDPHNCGDKTWNGFMCV
jgi:hypothetical protein